MEDPEITRERMKLTQVINNNAQERPALVALYGSVWDTKELQVEFEVQGFAAPFVVVKRKKDGKRGTLTFQHMPRFYFDFREV